MGIIVSDKCIMTSKNKNLLLNIKVTKIVVPVILERRLIVPNTFEGESVNLQSVRSVFVVGI